MSTYIKHLVLVDIQKLPVYKASDRVEKAYLESLKDRGASTKGKNPIEVLRNLTK